MEILGTINTTLSLAGTLKDALEAKELYNMVFDFGCKSEIDNFKRTVESLTAVLRDAETKDLSSSHKLCDEIEKMKDAFYEADDLLDEFATLAHQQRLLDAEGSLREKVSNFFSRSNPICVSFWMSRGIKDIKKKLDAIAYNKQFGFEHDPKPIMMRRPETCSYVNEGEIIGRDEDVEKIVGMLLDPNVQQDVSFLGIVGMGGLGKTALAQLVFNDPRVTAAFPLKLWTCVSDQDQKLDVKEVLGKILASASPSNRDEGSTLDHVQNQLRQCLESNKYLLILDDVWTEDRESWCGLARYFVGGQHGSWIVVTTRSERTATIIGDNACQMYKLRGLSEAYSWHLFQRTAFGSDESNVPADLVNIGREIVDECVGLPLALRVIGSLLYGQDMRKWQSVKEIGLANIRKNEEGIMPILKLSYHHLEAPLKSCFSYCALFPKDFQMKKEMLIDLWIAQGYVVPFCNGQDLENAGEEYFSILLKRCFFQDIERDHFGEIISCKMHDLIHDLAQSVSGKEIYLSNTCSRNVDEKIRHFSIPTTEYEKHSLDMTLLRSYILIDGQRGVKMGNSSLEVLISSCGGARAFRLAGVQMKSLPNFIGTLLHLRYLDLSNNDLEELPRSISKLYNLQFLNLEYCSNLKELPKDISKLVKLRVLNISHCFELKYMPKGMDKMTSLHKLSDFIVGSEGDFVSWKQWFDGLEDLKALNNLKGELDVHIKWPKKAYNVVSEVNIGKGYILRNTKHLNKISITFGPEGGGGILDDEGILSLMEILQPHSNLKSLEIWYYEGTRMPDWASYHLPNLVKLELWDCWKLEGWRRGAEDGSSNNKTSILPKLKSLTISESEMRWIPQCPNLETLDLTGFNERMVFGEDGLASASTTCEVNSNSCPKLKKIRIDNMAWLNSQAVDSFKCLQHLIISEDEEVEKLGAVEEVFRSCSPSLRKLEIEDCRELKSVVGGGLEHLTALEELEFSGCINLSLSEEEKEGEDAAECPSLLPSLHTLKLKALRKLKNMPKWMPKLTSLRNLNVYGCSKSLERRCQEDPQGEDWPLIQHIPNINIVEGYRIDYPLTDTDAEEYSDSDINSEKDTTADTLVI